MTSPSGEAEYLPPSSVRLWYKGTAMPIFVCLSARAIFDLSSVLLSRMQRFIRTGILIKCRPPARHKQPESVTGR